jgi:NAD(P)-dependent dehydrogenase (short-subunit alcohol dehydrogenase family)
MDLQLEGKRALVTGSSSGIGAATAKLLAAEGVSVAVHGRNAERALEVAAEIRADGGTVIVAIGDLADDEQANEVCAKVDAELGGVDVLFNNAGGRNPSKPANAGFFELDPADWLVTYNINVVSAVRMIRHFAPGMIERGWGRIIQNGSASATSPSWMLNDYAASKAAILNLTAGLAKALAGTGVTVTTVSPGMTMTPSVSGAYMTTYAEEQGWDASLPLDELEKKWAKHRGLATVGGGRVEHIASAVAWLASPLGGYVDGANIRVDGGQNQNIN